MNAPGLILYAFDCKQMCPLAHPGERRYNGRRSAILISI
jgi:hypothetical protein